MSWNSFFLHGSKFCAISMHFLFCLSNSFCVWKTQPLSKYWYNLHLDVFSVWVQLFYTKCLEFSHNYKKKLHSTYCKFITWMSWHKKHQDVLGLVRQTWNELISAANILLHAAQQPFTSGNTSSIRTACHEKCMQLCVIYHVALVLELHSYPLLACLIELEPNTVNRRFDDIRAFMRRWEGLLLKVV